MISSFLPANTITPEILAAKKITYMRDVENYQFGFCANENYHFWTIYGETFQCVVAKSIVYLSPIIIFYCY